jgi:hypothetical protein
VATWHIHVVSDPDRPVGATVAVRRGDDLSELSTDWALATADLLSEAAPWRTFRWYRGQKHYSGTYRSSTEAKHVIYESRLELTRLLYADFDGSVRRIVAQPFHLTATVERRTRNRLGAPTVKLAVIGGCKGGSHSIEAGRLVVVDHIPSLTPASCCRR